MMAITNTNKPTEVERNMALISRRVTEIGSSVARATNLRQLLDFREELRGLSAGVNNLRFVVAFNPLEETARTTLTEDKLQNRLIDLNERCATTEGTVERSVDRLVSSRVKGYDTSKIKTLCASFGPSEAIEVAWTAVDTNGQMQPILHVNLKGAKDRANYEHACYHIWARPKGRGFDMNTGFGSIPPNDNWISCANNAALGIQLRQRFEQDGF